LVLITEELQHDVAELLDFVSRNSVERAFLPVGALQQLAEVAARTGTLPRSLGEIVATAEQLLITPPIVELLDGLATCTLHHQYGSSETHVVSSFTLEGSPDGWPALPPIGRPIANVQIYLLDGNMQPVPVGIAGELYVGGDSLARGYLHRPDLTADRFVPSPFGDLPGMRLYKTGDLARYLPDGNLEFLGRSDSQVKIRGSRVELGEIEVVLGQHSRVRKAVVLAKEGVQGGNQLVAYVVPAGAHVPGPADLRSFLRARLPDHMIPTVFVMLDSLPLTPSGKVNRRALPEPDWSKRELEEAYVAPRTPVEGMLAGIWVQILGVKEVGVHDNFFELGGHSLLATQIISRTRDIFRLDLSLRTIFEAPTVAGMAQAIIALEAEPGRLEKAALLLKTIKDIPPDDMRRMVEEQRKER
jgi:acyl-coenzyme A synthetase/AMP-(fatty) acid ligase